MAYKTISAAEGISNIKTHNNLSNSIIEDNFAMNMLLDKEDNFYFDILIENCIFYYDFITQLGIYHGNVVIKNCIFHRFFIFHGVNCLQYVRIENGRFDNLCDIDCGSFNRETIFNNNVFTEFVNFQDQDFQGPSFFINNVFQNGTHLLHPEGAPNGAHFAYLPVLEGNIGLDKFEGGRPVIKIS